MSQTPNPADCASRSLYPVELLEYPMWWNGPEWVRSPEAEWPSMPPLSDNPVLAKERDQPLTCLLVTLIEIPILHLGWSFLRNEGWDYGIRVM